jgi:hypothetical protein
MEALSNIVEQDKTYEKLTNFWENVLFIVITYNFITFCFFVGIPGFPSQWWIYLEFLGETIMIVDNFIRIVLRRLLLGHRRTLNLLHQSSDDKLVNSLLFIVSSMPSSLLSFALQPED